MASNTETNFPDKIVAPWTNFQQFGVFYAWMTHVWPFLSIHSFMIDDKMF